MSKPFDVGRLKSLIRGTTPGQWVHGHFADDGHSCNCTSIVAEFGPFGGIADILIDNGLDISEGGNGCPPQ